MRTQKQFDFFETPKKRSSQARSAARSKVSRLHPTLPALTASERRAFQPRRLVHGGETSIGRRKLKRPFDRRRPLHLVLRSESAKGALSLRSAKHRLEIDRLIKREAMRNHVTLHRVANVGNHIHLFASFDGHESFKRFLRTVTGLIARLVTGARKGRSFGKRFWDHLAFSRVVTGRSGYRRADHYVQANQIEGAFGRWQRGLFENAPARYRGELGDFMQSLEAGSKDNGP